MGGIEAEQAILRKSAEERSATPGYAARVSAELWGPFGAIFLGALQTVPYHFAETLCRVDKWWDYISIL